MLRSSVYLDTSVISAYFDRRAPDRQNLTKTSWQRIQTCEVFISSMTLKEINDTSSVTLRKK